MKDTMKFKENVFYCMRLIPLKLKKKLVVDILRHIHSLKKVMYTMSSCISFTTYTIVYNVENHLNRIP